MKDLNTPTKIIDLDIQKIGKTSLSINGRLKCRSFTIK